MIRKKTIAFKNFKNKWHAINELVSTTYMSVCKTIFKHRNRYTACDKSCEKISWIGRKILEVFYLLLLLFSFMLFLTLIF